MGDDTVVMDVRESLFALGFHHEVFKRARGQAKSKGVDITLTKDMLSHAFMNTYDASVLVAGDGDYVPLVNEVKRLGKVVYVIFFKDTGFNRNLALAADAFFAIDDAFIHFFEHPFRGSHHT
jgi:uncharacterized LabA/DUF88 family protein